MSNLIEKLREVLGQIAALDITLDAPIGDEARLEMAVDIAREALALSEGVEVVEFDVYEEGMPGNRLIEIPCARPALLLIKKEPNDE